MLPLLVRHADIAQFREVLARLDVLLIADEREFAESLNPPATDSEIEALRASLDPYELIDEVELLYRWHNGQDDRLGWPLLESGPLLAASEAVKHRDLLRDDCELWQWSASWLPITHSSWNQSAVELGEPLQGIVVDASFPDGPTVQAESLAAAVQAICSLIEAGVPLDTSASTDPDRLAWMKRRNEALQIKRTPILQWRQPKEQNDEPS
jgi:hypothetical protein